MKEETGSLSNRITKDTSLKGDITSDSDFRIDGRLEGDLRIKGRLILGKDADIKGNVVCNTADVSGKIVGNVKADHLFLRSECLLEGEVEIGKLTVDAGAVFNASCKMATSPKEAAQESARQKK